MNRDLLAIPYGLLLTVMVWVAVVAVLAAAGAS